MAVRHASGNGFGQPAFAVAAAPPFRHMILSNGPAPTGAGMNAPTPRIKDVTGNPLRLGRQIEDLRQIAVTGGIKSIVQAALYAPLGWLAVIFSMLYSFVVAPVQAVVTLVKDTERPWFDKMKKLMQK